MTWTCVDLPDGRSDELLEFWVRVARCYADFGNFYKETIELGFDRNYLRSSIDE